ncbi:hypothetical protein, partial [Lacticaseibacillus paracasei]|uniref:hypothetical protein n=1 Tax=Lacticaseibacillus paracasei TaxID=1597 RepID=UPI001952019F
MAFGLFRKSSPDPATLEAVTSAPPAVVQDAPKAATHDSAREMRLLLQRMLDLDFDAFTTEMRRLYFHLFAIDHDHYRDLLFQAAQKNPAAVR